jgi:hypothetical protein
VPTVNIDPWKEDLVHEVDTTGVPTGTKISVVVAWSGADAALGNHTSWQGTIAGSSSFVDERVLRPVKYEVDGATTGASTDLDWAVTWPFGGGDFEVNQAEMEIFAVIRAEYRFIMDGWQKVAVKKSSQGMDSLFKKTVGMTRYFAIVESKCTSKVKDYDDFVAANKTPLAKLGRPNPYDHSQKGKKKAYLSSTGVRQMSDPWIVHAFQQERVGTADATVKANLTLLHQDMAGGASPFRFMNVYAADPFYCLPGVYTSTATVFHTGPPPTSIALPLDDIEVDFPDDKYRDDEFFGLDVNTVSNAGAALSGSFQDVSAAFAAMVAKDKINMGALNNVKADNAAFFV